MGCVLSKLLTEEEVQARERSKVLDAELLKEKKKLKEMKLLLLGAGEAGKSTFAKQMKILYTEGFKEDDCLTCRPAVYYNIFDSCKKLIAGAKMLNLRFESEGFDEVVKYFEELDLDLDLTDLDLMPDAIEKVKRLWQEPGILEAYAQRAKFQLNDSTEYFFQHLDRVGARDYVPTQEDVLRVRIKTTGALETTFKVGDLLFRMVDVGGQRNERRKWYHSFEDVTSVLFLVAMSEYDQVLEEKEKMNRMKESLKLFRDVINNEWFKNTPIMLFLNKKDLFYEKIKTVDMNPVCFTTYKGGCDPKKATKFLEKRFRETNGHPNRQIYVHLTCATDTENAKKVFNTVQEDMLRTVMKRNMMV